jgi:hypothetical protein
MVRVSKTALCVVLATKGALWCGLAGKAKAGSCIGGKVGMEKPLTALAAVAKNKGSSVVKYVTRVLCVRCRLLGCAKRYMTCKVAIVQHQRAWWPGWTQQRLATTTSWGRVRHQERKSREKALLGVRGSGKCAGHQMQRGQREAGERGLHGGSQRHSQQAAEAAGAHCG